MKKRLNSGTNIIAAFFVLYFLLMTSIIVGVTSVGENSTFKKNNPENVESAFKDAIKKSELKQEQKKKELEQSDRWRPSDRFVMIALTAASVLDIIIVLVWAHYENEKREGETPRRRNRITDKKWFWKVAALGIVQPEDNKLVLKWKNLILFVISMYFIKKIISNHL